MKAAPLIAVQVRRDLGQCAGKDVPITRRTEYFAQPHQTVIERCDRGRALQATRELQQRAHTSDTDSELMQELAVAPGTHRFGVAAYLAEAIGRNGRERVRRRDVGRQHDPPRAQRLGRP